MGARRREEQLRAGKFPVHLMERLISKVDVSDPRVLLGPRVGEDVAVLDYGDRVLVAKSDPMTFATQRVGWYAVQVNANDVACAGAVPRWFLATLLVPESTSEHEAESIFSQIPGRLCFLKSNPDRGPQRSHHRDQPAYSGGMYVGGGRKR